MRRSALSSGWSSGADAIPKIAERTGQHWAKQIVAKVPTSKLLQINKELGRNFITKYGTKQGIIVLGMAVPFGIGAVIGGGASATRVPEHEVPESALR
jgi:hypothetical protein